MRQSVSIQDLIQGTEIKRNIMVCNPWTWRVILGVYWLHLIVTYFVLAATFSAIISITR